MNVREATLYESDGFRIEIDVYGLDSVEEYRQLHQRLGEEVAEFRRQNESLDEYSGDRDA